MSTAVAASSHRSPAEPLRVGPFDLAPDEGALRFDGRVVALTRREFQLLHALAARSGHVVRRDVLQQEIWGTPVPGHQDRSLDVYIRKLRQKLTAAAPQWQTIHTHHGIGYRFEPELLTRPHARGRRP